MNCVLQQNVILRYIFTYVGEKCIAQKVNRQWKKLIPDYIPLRRSSVIISISLLQWANQLNGCPLDETVYQLVIISGNLKVLQWIGHIRGGNVIKRGLHNVLQLGGYLNSNFLDNTYVQKCLEWSNNYSLNKQYCAFAAQYGHLKVLQYLRLNACPWDEWTCSLAALNGNLEVLQWAQVNGCPWDKYTYRFAFLSGNDKVIEWVTLNACSWDKTCCTSDIKNRYLDNNISNGHMEVLQWARTHS